MTQAEADAIAAVIRTADSGCSVCVRGLCERMTAAGLGWTFSMSGRDIEVIEQPDWSTDPDDAETRTYPEVVATVQ
jgi:hypothetical protein